MSENIVIPKKLFDEMILHCNEACPAEACGILAGAGSVVQRMYPMSNIEKSSVSYLMDSKEQFRVMKDMRKDRLNMLAIFHSHPGSSAYPSAKDVSLAFYDHASYVIVSFAQSEPVVKGFSIKNGNVDEISIEITPE